MNEGTSKLAVVNTLLLAGVLVSTLLVTCSNDAVERRLIAIEKKIGQPGQRDDNRPQSTQPAPAPGSSQSPAPTGNTSPAPTAPTPVAPATVPGTGTGYFAVGAEGRRVEITYVEGRLPNGPLTLDQKPRPQNDAYINRRPSPPKSLNFYTSNEGETNQVTNRILGRMLDINPHAPPKVDPSLAVSWDISPDKMKYTYHLRRGVQFADGRPFSSADIAFSWAIINNSAVRAEHLRAGIDDIESVETPDPYTVIVTYKKLYWAGLYDLGFGLKVLDKGWWEEQIPVFAKKLGLPKWSIDPTTEEFAAVFNKVRIPGPGTGPYYVPDEESFTKQRIVMIQNPFWWGIQVYGDQYNVKRFEYTFISDDVVADEEFRKGNFDVQVVNADRWDDQLQFDTAVTGIARHFVYDHMGLGYRFVAWNCRKPPFDDARVRRAMTHLFDRDWMVRELQRGRGSVATCPTKSIYPSFSNDIEPWPFSPERAKEILAEAGWKDSNGDGVLDRGGVKLEFQFKYPAQIPEFGRISDSFIEAAKKAGVLVTPVQLEWSVFIQDYYDRKFDGACLLTSFSSPWIDPYGNYHSSQDVPQGGNSAGWRHDEADELMLAMRQEFDDDKRNAMFRRFNRIFHEEQPLTLLTYSLVDVLAANRFEEVKVYPVGLDWRWWWVKPENVKHR